MDSFYEAEFKKCEQCKQLIKNTKRDLISAFMKGNKCARNEENHYSEEVNKCAAKKMMGDAVRLKIEYKRCVFYGREAIEHADRNCFMVDVCFD